MATISSAPRTGRAVLWNRLATRPFTLLAVLLLIGTAFPFLLRHESEWEDVYVRAANHLRAGETIYRAEEGYVYPPFMAVLALPFALLPQPAERFAWYLVNAACTLLLCRWAWQLAGGGRLEGGPVARGERLACVLGLACGFRYVMDGLSHQQTDVVLGALLLGGCRALGRGRAGLAATCFGVAAGAKCTPLLWCGYLLWRRQWRAAGWLTVVAAGVNLLPDLVHGPPGGGLWLAEWFRRYLLPLTGADCLPGSWYSEIIYNQSLAGAVNRWFTTGWTWTASGFGVVSRPDIPSPAALKALLYGVELTLLAGVALAFRRGRSRVPPAGEALEYGVVLLLMLLCSPMSSKPHFCTVLLPAFCLARLAVGRRDRWLALVLAGAIVLGSLATKGLCGGDAAALALWFGNVMWMALFLLAGCAHALVNEHRIGYIDPTPPGDSRAREPKRAGNLVRALYRIQRQINA